MLILAWVIIISATVVWAWVETASHGLKDPDFWRFIGVIYAWIALVWAIVYLFIQALVNWLEIGGC